MHGDTETVKPNNTAKPPTLERGEGPPFKIRLNSAWHRMTNNVKQHRADHKTLLYATFIIPCANLRITLFPPIIVAPCQLPLRLSSLFLGLPSSTRTVARANNALRVRRGSSTFPYSHSRGSLFLAHRTGPFLQLSLISPSCRYEVVWEISIE